MFKRLNDDTSSVEFTFNGKHVKGRLGDTVATALLASGHVVFGKNLSSGNNRGPFCMMGSCFECTVEIDGRSVQACQAIAYQGLEVRILPLPSNLSEPI